MRKVKEFFKKNYYYVILGACVLAIGALVTVAILASNRPDIPVYEPNDNDNNDNDNDNDEPGPDPVLFFHPLGDMEVVLGRVQFNATRPQGNDQGEYRIRFGNTFLAEEGTPILAVTNGIVESITRCEAWGTTVVILHDDEVRSIYSNLAPTVSVLERQRVVAGQQIGVLGTPGRMQAFVGTHLNFEVTVNGSHVDPDLLLNPDK